MDLIAEYIEAVHGMSEIQASGLDNRKKVKQNNQLADRVREIASEIEAKYPDLKPDFYKLLFHEESTVRSWVAHHILEVMNYDDRCRKDALKEISYISIHDKSINGLGNKMWLKQWFERYPADKDLL